MKLSLFILDRMEEILTHWDEYARTLAPASEDMSHYELRDHGEAMLRAVALDIESPQSPQQQADKSRGGDDDHGASSAASKHGHLRQESNFTLLQMSSEFRALRAAVLRLWLQQVDALSPEVLEDVIRFNESIDQALAESIVTFSERADQSRDLFGAILGHDLRGPLSSITLAGDILVGQDVPANKVMELGANIKRSARFMASMVDDMLGFARTRMGDAGIPVDPALEDISVLCTDAIADASAMHPGCRFELETSGRLDACVDADRLHQLLVNLLGNAGQHGAEGCPVRLRASGDDEQTELHVENEGEIAPKSLKRIFEPLVRLAVSEGGTSRSTTSLGLGLYIARAIAEAHGGSIIATSKDNRTTLSVILPRNAPNARK